MFIAQLCFIYCYNVFLVENNGFSGLKTLIVVAYLDGMKTNQTQTQLLYHEWSTACENKQTEEALPFEIIIKLKVIK